VLSRRVAVKILRADLAADEGTRARFRHEAIAAARLSHPNIVSTYDTGDDDGIAYIVMELIEGTTLRHLIDEHGGLPVADVIRIGKQVADALDAAHRAGLVHRDVKPANVFLGDDGRTTLLDFGLACAAVATRENEVGVGTMEYAAPEQICGGPVDRRADIYSLGCVLYELVTGRLPFRGDSASEIAERQIRRAAVAPSVVSADVPGQLDDLVISMLAKTPAHRPDSATEVGWRLANIARRVSQRHVLSVDEAHHRFRQAG
jgi:serine/threonine-protein kinase